MAGLDWLTRRPVAHRGLHDAAGGVIENTASAFAAAVAGDFAIETDLQLSADGEAMVHHDHALGRLTEGSARLADLPAAELKKVAFKATGDRMQTLGEMCDQVAGRSVMLLELKSRFTGDTRLAERAADVLESYHGPVAVMSFDPVIVAAIGATAPGLPRGIVAEYQYRHHEWARLGAGQKRALRHLLHAFRTRPHFVAYAVDDLPAPAPWIARRAFGLPLLTWTVRNEAQRRHADRWADQMIFEGFRP